MSVYKYVKQEDSEDYVSEGNLRWDKDGREKKLQAFLDANLTSTFIEHLCESKS